MNGDYRKRNLISTVAFAAIGTTDSAFIPANNKRVALFIGPPNQNRYTVTDQPAAVLDNGLTFNLNSGGMWLNIWEHGSLVQKPMRAIMATAPGVASFIEVIDPDF